MIDMIHCLTDEQIELIVADKADRYLENMAKWHLIFCESCQKRVAVKRILLKPLSLLFPIDKKGEL
jgi:hypothetical protein